jgi:phosphohistidine phosphatase
MKLYLMRHGQAASPQVDPQQGLTEAGRAEIEQLASRLVKRAVHFEQVLHSDKARAQQTAEIMAAVLAPGVIPRMRCGLKPNDDPAELIPDIEAWNEDTLITSHLPFVPNLLAELTGQVQGMGFVPGSVICLLKQGDTWQLDWIETP